MERQRYFQEIAERIESYEYGQVFIISDFVDIASESATKMAMGRLFQDGIIRRIMRGIYDKPKYSKLLEEYVAPDTEKVAKAIARNYGWNIAPSGNMALNLLRLSTQVPAILVYVSDGPYKEYECGKSKIKFKHVANKEIYGLSYITGVVVQAIKALEKEKITNKDIEILKSVLMDADKNTILAEAQGSTKWVYAVIKQVCEEKNE